jgi:NADPH-dependent 2,4-dienoyl-CoA reductase/sulfur reductase-like enzyme
VVIGGDAAGMSAAAVAKRRRPELDVVAFDKGPYTSYSACGIPFYLGGAFDDADRLVSRSPEEHREHGIDVHMRTEVTAIDLDARRLTVFDHAERAERTEPFDQLVIATGARAVGPPVPGIEHVEPARTVDAAQRFATRLDRGGERAVVIGGSYIGLEMAEALVKRGLRTTILERADQVMRIALDPDMAEHVQDAAEGEGIDVRLSTEVTGVELDGDGRPVAVHAGDERFPADHVVLATGVKAETGLARAAGLEVGDHGIATDDHQRCAGADGVFAAGDCVQTWHRLLERPLNVQLGTHANKQGRVAGLNASGADAAFPGVIGTSATKICKYEIARTGLVERETREILGREVVSVTIESKTQAGYMPGVGPIWVKLVADPDGTVLGGQVVGHQGSAKRIDVIAAAVWTGMDVRELEFLDLSYAPPFSPVYDPVLTAARALAAKLP